MTKVDFAICGNAAFTVLRDFVATFGGGAIGLVQVCTDPDLTGESANGIIEWCAKEEIPATINSRPAPSANRCFFIGWPVKAPANNRNIVLHEGLLPRYRGYAPLINSLISGEREIGVTALVSAGPNDDGPILEQEKLFIDYPLTIKEAIGKMTPLYFSVIASIYKKISEGKPLVTIEQDHYLATYGLPIHPSDYRINWGKSAEVIKRTIDALGYPYAGVTANVEGRQVAIQDARIVGDVVIENRTPGKVIFLHDGCPVVVCSSGLLAITAATYIDTKEPLLPLNDIKLLFQ